MSGAAGKVAGAAMSYFDEPASPLDGAGRGGGILCTLVLSAQDMVEAFQNCRTAEPLCKGAGMMA